MKREQWQQGNDSEMNSMDRLELHILWLQQLHSEMKQVILERKIKEFGKEDTIEGYSKD